MRLKRRDQISVPRFEDCNISAIHPLWRPNTNNLTSEERATKRRRIEDNARRYLAGETLHIQSAALRGPFNSPWQNPWREDGQEVGSENEHGTEPEKISEVEETVPGKLTEAPKHIEEPAIERRIQPPRMSTHTRWPSELSNKTLGSFLKSPKSTITKATKTSKISKPRRAVTKDKSKKKSRKAQTQPNQPQLTLISVTKITSQSQTSQNKNGDVVEKLDFEVANNPTHIANEIKEAGLNESGSNLGPITESFVAMNQSTHLENPLSTHISPPPDCKSTPPQDPIYLASMALAEIPSTDKQLESATAQNDPSLHSLLPEHQDSRAYSPPSMNLPQQTAPENANEEAPASHSLRRKSALYTTILLATPGSSPPDGIVRKRASFVSWAPTSRHQDPHDENQDPSGSQFTPRSSSQGRPSAIPLQELSSQHSANSQPVEQGLPTVSFVPSALVGSEQMPGPGLPSWQAAGQAVGTGKDVGDWGDFDLEQSIDEAIDFLNVDWEA
jgi:hypothetical protein